MHAILLLAVLAGQPPADYVLSKLDAYPIVILGEGHWLRTDPELVTALVPRLRERNVALAMEFFGDQEKLDRLVNGETWDEALANEIMKDADWPYVQYRDILEAAWKHKLRVPALNPPRDWRAKKIPYDGTMAARVMAYAGDGDIPKNRVLIYCGMHHAFTRYQQIERIIDGRATQFMERMGNILWRRYGENVFLIALHKTESCGETTQCLPLDGAIDCAAKEPVGFDILSSPFAETKIPASSFYAKRHPNLRFMDYADGYIWTTTVDRMRGVDVLPLPEFQTEEWKKHAASLAKPIEREPMKKLMEWRTLCAPPAR
jgi:hypothetical protein